jgi:hypothetical protein
MLLKYEKVPERIVAMQYTGDNLADLKAFCGDKLRDSLSAETLDGTPVKIDSAIVAIETPDGHKIVYPGDYVGRDIHGDFLHYRKNRFLAEYRGIPD